MPKETIEYMVQMSLAIETKISRKKVLIKPVFRNTLDKILIIAKVAHQFEAVWEGTFL